MKIGLIAAAIAVCATSVSAQSLEQESEIDIDFAVLEMSAGANGGKTITTRRQEENGVNIYAQHDVSCDPYLAGLAGAAPTLEALNTTLVSNPPLGEIIRGSAEDAIAGYACEN